MYGAPTTRELAAALSLGNNVTDKSEALAREAYAANYDGLVAIKNK